MVTVGIVKEWSVGKGYRTKLDVINVKVEIDDPNDIQTIEYLFATGENSMPIKGNTVLIHEVSDEYKVATASNTGVIVTLLEGEKALYAIKDGEVKAVISLLVNGEIVLNGGTGNAVEFSDLKSGFDQIKQDYNSLVNLLKTWTPVPNDGGTALKTAVNTLNPVTTASVDDSKVEKVRV